VKHEVRDFREGRRSRHVGQRFHRYALPGGNITAARTVRPTFLCPSDPARGAIQYWGAIADMCGVAIVKRPTTPTPVTGNTILGISPTQKEFCAEHRQVPAGCASLPIFGMAHPTP